MAEQDDIAVIASGDSNRARVSAPSAADMWVGNRVRLRRLELGIALQGLADTLGLSKNQLMKYEGGENRLTCGRLYDIAQALRTDPGFFFAEFPGASDLVMPASDIVALLRDGASIDIVRLYSRLTPDQGRATRTILESLVAGNDAIAGEAIRSGGLPAD